MPLRLTDAKVAALPSKATRYDVRDSDVVGLEVRVTPTGVKSYSVLYRVAGARQKSRLTLGRVGKINLSAARSIAREALVAAARGEDPSAAKKARRLEDETTVGQLGVTYLSEVRRRRKPRTAAEYERLWKAHVAKPLGGQPVARVTPAQIGALHRDLGAHPYQANRVLALVATFFSFAAREGHVLSNPAARIEPYPEHSRERFLKKEELVRLMTAIDTAETVGLPPAPKRQRKEPDAENAKHSPPPAPDKKNRARGSAAPANPIAIASLRLLVLSGWREQEVLSLRWDAVDLERGIATLANTKTGKSQRHMSSAAVALLDALPRHTDSPWCFPSPKKPQKHLADIGRLWDAVRHAAQLKGFRLHDTRHSAASFAISAGASLAVVGKMLGHSNHATTAKYAHLADDPVRAATESVAMAVAAATKQVDAERTTPKLGNP
jgi:integrase